MAGTADQADDNGIQPWLGIKANPSVCGGHTNRLRRGPLDTSIQLRAQFFIDQCLITSIFSSIDKEHLLSLSQKNDS